MKGKRGNRHSGIRTYFKEGFAMSGEGLEKFFKLLAENKEYQDNLKSFGGDLDDEERRTLEEWLRDTWKKINK